jgi:hypothetical protein
MRKVRVVEKWMPVIQLKIKMDRSSRSNVPRKRINRGDLLIFEKNHFRMNRK